MLGLLLLLMAVVSGQDIGGYCECKSCLEVKDDTYYYAEDQGDRCGQGCLMATDQGDDEICVCHAPINVTGGETALVGSCTSPIDSVASEACISSPKDYKVQMESILAGGPRTGYVCKGTLMSMVNPYDVGQPMSPSPNQQGNAWAWASGWPVLNHFLDLASRDCTRSPPRAIKPKTCRRLGTTGLIKDMLHYVGYGPEDINLTSTYVITVFETARAQAAWDYKPFQPTWSNVYQYLNQPGGFQVCDGPRHDDCTRKQMPDGFMNTFTVMNGSTFKGITNCDDDGIKGCFPEWTQDMADFKDLNTNKCTNCSKDCVQFYIDRFGQKKTATILWTRAFFLNCFDMNPHFTGKGVGYDPVAKKLTGPEWLVRGDSGVPTTGSSPNSLKAKYIKVYP